MLKINFSYTDEFGQESSMVKTFTHEVLEVEDTFYLLVDEFKKFLISSGFSSEHVDQIQIIE